jgi:hypothetical protein
LPEKEEEYLVDQVIYIMEHISIKNFNKVLKIFYPKLKVKNPMKIAQLFIKGFSENKFFEYVFFVEGLSGKPNVTN